MITGELLLEIFAAYNTQIWPMQIVAYLLGITGVLLVFRKSYTSSRAVLAILTFYWLWVALVFWLPSILQGFIWGIVFFTLFLVQGVLLLIFTLKAPLLFGYRKDIYSWVGICIVLYALLGYPLISKLVGHTYPRMPSFGLTPCPVTTFTFGLFLLTRPKFPIILLIIPLIYSFSGIMWISIGAWEDIGMVAGGLLATCLIWWRNSITSATPINQPPSSSKQAGWSLNLPDK